MKVKIGVSNRHVHLSKNDFDFLFPNTLMNKVKDLSQKGEYVSDLFVSIKTNKGVLNKVRVVGPLRDKTQVEISRTDAYFLGINPPVRMSGDLDNSEDVILINNNSELLVENSCILAHRHIHMSTNDAIELGYKSGDIVKVKIMGERGGIYDNVEIKIKDSYTLELHLDTDEANAMGVKNGDEVEFYGSEEL